MVNRELHTSNTVEREISLREIIIRMKKWLIYLRSNLLVFLLIACIGCILGFLYASSKPVLYKSETTFVLEEDTGSGMMLGQIGGLASMVGMDAGSSGGIFQGDNIIELYRSKSMVEKTLLSSVVNKDKKLLLIDYYLEFTEIRDSWDKSLKGFNFTKGSSDVIQRTQDSILRSIAESIISDALIVSKPDKKLGIVKVEVRSPDEFFAKTFNDQIVENVNDFYVQTKTKKALENLAILQHQTDSVRNVLSGAIYETALVTDATPNLNPTRQILRASAQNSQFNAEANKAILSQLVQNLELAKLSLRKETPLILVVDKPLYPLKKEIYGKFYGAIIGFFLFGFLALIMLIIKKLFIDILNE